MPKVLIIGAGLSGLSTAYVLRNSNFDVEILEARPRLGGRIYTIKKENSQLEMGATWFGPQHTSLIQLIKELNIPFKTQDNGAEAIYDFRPKGNIERFQIPSQGAATYKFTYGTSHLIETLAEASIAKIHFDEVVASISVDEHIKVSTSTTVFEADYLVLSIPTQLISDRIEFRPKLSETFNQLLQDTHTWMSDSIKFSMAYEDAFWKSQPFIGTLMSPHQIIQEMYDHSNTEGDQNALVGFLNSNYSNLNPEERKEKVTGLLESYFPDKEIRLKAYADLNWRNEPYTIPKNAKSLAPHQNNGNPKLRDSLFDNRLFFSASETAQQTPGYMDGAVHRGREVADFILNLSV
jgi:monoamine oxidase